MSITHVIHTKVFDNTLLMVYHITMKEEIKRNLTIYKKKTRTRNPMSYRDLARAYDKSEGRMYQIVHDIKVKIKLGIIEI